MAVGACGKLVVEAPAGAERVAPGTGDAAQMQSAIGLFMEQMMEFAGADPGLVVANRLYEAEYTLLLGFASSLSLCAWYHAWRLMSRKRQVLLTAKPATHFCVRACRAVFLRTPRNLSRSHRQQLRRTMPSTPRAAVSP